MTTKVNIARYATELLMHAAVYDPWEVSEDEFTTIVAMLTDGTDLKNYERESIHDFLISACNTAARFEPNASTISAVYQAARTHAALEGRMVFGG